MYSTNSGSDEPTKNPATAHHVPRHNAGTANDRTIVFADANGDGRSDFQIELTGLKTLKAGDFVL